MAKKTLNEAVVRRFQKLANVAPINEMYANESYHMKEEEEDAAEAPAAELDADDDKMDDMPKMDDDMEDKSAEVTEKAIEDARAGVDAISDLLNSILPDDGGEDVMDDMPMDDDMAGDDMDGEDELAGALQEALSGINYVPSQSEIVNEVAQRVARRLQEAKLHEAKLN